MSKREEVQQVRFNGDKNLAPRLYRRSYFFPGGKVTTRFFCLFTDWQGIRRKLSLGKDQKQAISKIYDLDRKNHAEVDFDEQQRKRAARGMTFSKFLAQCPNSMKTKSPWHLKPVERHLGAKVIAQLSNDDIAAYREK